ncbi:RNA polymerase sigma factor [Streptomyces niveus]|uniref:RNA polymerase sigma factor n=1 Tax=Streptomyces niveus TaxID=193462 RepID=UPI0036C46F9B
MANTPEDSARWERQIQIRLTRGEAAALGELYDRHARLVHGLAARLTGEEKATRELVARVFAELWLRPGAFDQARYRLATWLAIRTCELAAEHVPRARMNGHRDLDLIEEDTRADEAITELSPRVRRALHLTHTAELDYRQTAAALGVSEEEILNRLRLGLQTIAARTGAVREDRR